MKRFWRFCLFGTLAVAASPAFATTFPLSDLQPGLTGYGLTAGPGNVVERFGIEVLGLQADTGLGFPVVLVQASGDFITASGGVAAGMSGSPVYLSLNGEDALLGAVGYVFPSSDHSLALVTPIATMQEATTADFVPFGRERFAGLGAAVPVRTPLLLSGVSERASRRVEPLFQAAGLEVVPVQTGGGGFDEGEYRLEPGSAVSVQLVRGDVTVAAVGTVTSVEQDTVLAFGHPLLNAGTVSFAFAPAFVSYIVPSDVVPFKLADSGKTVLGTILQDRPAAIAGRLNETPDLLPVTLTLDGPGGTTAKAFEITRDERFYAPLLATATLQLLDEARAQVGAGTVDLAWDITLQDDVKLRVLEQVSDPDDVASAAAGLAATPLAVLAGNIFEAPDVQRVAVRLSFEDDQRTAEIIEVIADSETLQPGQPFNVHVRLQPYRSPPVVENLSLYFPKDATGDLTVTFRGGLTAPENEEEVEKEDGNPILSFGELLVVLHDQVQSSELVVETELDGETVRLERLTFPYLVRGEKTLSVTVGEEDSSPEETAPDDTVPAEPVPAPDEILPDPSPDPVPPLEPSP